MSNNVNELLLAKFNTCSQQSPSYENVYTHTHASSDSCAHRQMGEKQEIIVAIKVSMTTDETELAIAIYRRVHDILENNMSTLKPVNDTQETYSCC